MSAQPDSGMTAKDKYIPWYFVAFFAGLAVIDGIFVTVALSTHTGLVTENAYNKGLAYNKTIEAHTQQQQLGWNSVITWSKPALSVALTDAEGVPLTQATVTAHISRPTQAGHDFTTILTHDENGRYTDSITFPLNGVWHIRIAAQWNTHHHQTSQKIIVR